MLSLPAGYGKIIREELQKMDLYEPAFELTIWNLDKILKDLKRVSADFKNEGSLYVVYYPHDKPIRNPLYLIMSDLRNQALRYLNSLGLTAEGRQRVIGKVPAKPEPRSVSKFDKIVELVR